MPTSGLCMKSPCISLALKKKICKRMRVVVKDNWEMLSAPDLEIRINPDWRVTLISNTHLEIICLLVSKGHFLQVN